MKQLITSCLALMLWLSSSLVLRGQEDPPQLTAIRAAIERHIIKKKHTWRRKTVTPMEGSQGVIIDRWESDSDDQAVVITIILHKSSTEATAALEDFSFRIKEEERAAKAHGKHDFKGVKEQLSDLGDNGFTWDVRGSTATAFRKNDLTVYVSVVKPESNKDDKLSKEFAQSVANALSNFKEK